MDWSIKTLSERVLMEDIEREDGYCDYTDYVKNKRIKKYGNCNFQSRMVSLAERYGNMYNVFDHKDPMPTVTSWKAYRKTQYRRLKEF